ncbi:MAG: OmpA family protein [Hyphomicrobium sp.]
MTYSFKALLLASVLFVPSAAAPVAAEQAQAAAADARPIILAASDVLTPEQKKKIAAAKKKAAEDAARARAAKPPAATTAPAKKPPATATPVVRPPAVKPPATVRAAPKVVTPPNNQNLLVRRSRPDIPTTDALDDARAARAKNKVTRRPAEVDQPEGGARRTNPQRQVLPTRERRPVTDTPPATVGQPKAPPDSAPLLVRRANAPKSLNALKGARKQTVDKVNNRTIIKEPDKRVIVRENNRTVIVKDENARFERIGRGARSERRRDGTRVTVIDRPNNVRIYSETDDDGRLIRRYRRDGSGRNHTIIDNRRRDRDGNFARNVAVGAGVGLGVAAGALLIKSLVDVPPPRVDIPRRKYIVEYDDASDEEIYEALSAPPVDRVERGYSLDEVRATPRLRERMRRIDLGDVTFEFGSWDVPESQYYKLERVARGMMRVIDRDQSEVFLIEGHTDAVGSFDDNLTLSDRRAESVAEILTERFGVPPENLTTQGYGEEYLKIDTMAAERLNRRVAVRRITPLLDQKTSAVDEQPSDDDRAVRDDNQEQYDRRDDRDEQYDRGDDRRSDEPEYRSDDAPPPPSRRY